MGFGGIGFSELLVLLAIVVMLFGTKRLRTLGGDVGAAIKGFKNALKDEEQKPETPTKAEDDKDSKSV